MTLLELQGVSKSYGAGPDRCNVLDDVSLRVEEGEFVAIVGFSGAGKSTLMSIMAGLERPDRGTVRFRGRPALEPGPDRALVFQSYALLPWLTVYGNVALAVDAVFRRESKAERAAHTRRYIELVGLAAAIDRKPAELSGGMRQRVAVARALAMRPEILLLDEPLSALDALTRARLQDEIEAIRAQEQRTVVLITNDVDEALLLADRIIPLLPGPAATLGPEYRVALPRPRDRTVLNHDKEFQRLRGAIAQTMMKLGSIRRPKREVEPQLPNVVPVRFPGPPPKAYRDAADSPIENRFVEFFQVTKSFPTLRGPLKVVDRFDLRMAKGESVALIGHSGCGKSTVLSMVAGLLPVSDGGIVVDGKEVVGAGPERAVVFQAPSLLPWLTAAQNVALGVDRVYPHAGRGERADIVAYYLNRVGLADSMHRRASELSNGMKQRVGIARAFALSPKLLLLDEPFGMLDTLTRWELQEVLMEVWTRTNVTAICVTHDIDEAILLGDRVVMMTNGPEARVGKKLTVDIPRPRSRRTLLDHPRYYAYREELLRFLAEFQHGAHPGGADAARSAA